MEALEVLEAAEAAEAMEPVEALTAAVAAVAAAVAAAAAGELCSRLDDNGEERNSSILSASGTGSILPGYDCLEMVGEAFW